MILHLFVVCAAFLSVVTLMPLFIKLAVKHSFVDKPGGRKQHEDLVPPVGGIVIFSIFIFASFIFGMGFKDTWAFFLALGLILVTGVIDDKWSVPAKFKFLIHFLSAFILVVLGHAQLLTLGNLLGLGSIWLGILAVPFSIACVVYIINAVNMMDGVDGLAGGQSLIIFLWLMIACAVAGLWQPFWSLALISACLAGFLIYNLRRPGRQKASVFLGDAGSMSLGLTIAWFAIHLSQAKYAVVVPASVAWIIALPIVDAFGLLVARLKDKKHPFEPDRRHFHHHFLDAGFTPGQTTAAILSIGAVFGAIGYLGFAFGIPEPLLGWFWIGLWLGHARLVMKPQGFVRLLERIRSRLSTQAPA